MYPAVSFNCGPETTCVQHTDYHNAPNVFCAVTALGNYDPTLGGHLILFPLKLVVEFPPGSTILLPSACISHGNTAIVRENGEERQSITQYCAGGLLRWVDYGFQTGINLDKTKEGSAAKGLANGTGDERWRSLLEEFPVY